MEQEPQRGDSATSGMGREPRGHRSSHLGPPRLCPPLSPIGLLWQLRPSDVEVELLAHTRDVVSRDLPAETGLHTGWVQNGGLFIASNKQRLDEYKRLMSVGSALGIPLGHSTALLGFIGLASGKMKPKGDPFLPFQMSFSQFQGSLCASSSRIPMQIITPASRWRACLEQHHPWAMRGIGGQSMSLGVLQQGMCSHSWFSCLLAAGEGVRCGVTRPDPGTDQGAVPTDECG